MKKLTQIFTPRKGHFHIQTIDSSHLDVVWNATSYFFCKLIRLCIWKVNIYVKKMLSVVLLVSIPYNNTYSPGQNERHFADDIFKGDFMNGSFVFYSNFTEICSQGPIGHQVSMVQVMDWHRTCDNPTESLLTPFTDAYMRHLDEMSVDLCL